MSDSLPPTDPAPKPAPTLAPFPEIKLDPDAVSALRLELESLVAAARGQVEALEKARASAEQGAADVGKHVLSAIEQQAALTAQVSIVNSHAAQIAAAAPGAIKAASECSTAATEVKAEHARLWPAVKGLDSVITAANAKAAEIAEIGVSVVKARSEIDAKTSEVTEAVDVAKKHAQSTATLSSEASAALTATQSASNQAKESSAQALAAFESLRTLGDAAVQNASRIEAIKTEATQTQEVIRTKNEHIEGGRKHVDEVRKELDAALLVAQASANASEAQHQQSREAYQNLSEIYANAQTVSANAENAAEETAESLKRAKGYEDVAKGIADIAETTKSRVDKYEATLSALLKQADTQRKRIDELLAGATDAGLASAFDKRASVFKRPEIVWQCIFAASLLGLVGVAIWHYFAFQKAGETPDWQQLLRILIIKIPFYAPLVWLAIHAARQGSFAKRMEEEYAFKATISRSFDGYRRQMADVGKEVAENSPLWTLSNNTLREIAAPPGRVYDGQKMDPNLASSVAEILKPTIETAVKTLSAKLPDMKT